MNFYLQRALAAIELKRWQLAQEEISRGLAEDPDDPRLHVVRAEVCYRELDFPEGRNAALHAIELSPDWSYGYYWLALNIVADFLEPDRAARAAEVAEQALACDPDDPDNHCLRAQVALFAGNPQEAIRYAESGLRIDPENVRCLQSLADAQLGLQLDSQAETTLRRMLQISPELNFAHQHLAALLLRTGRFAEAYEHGSTAIRENPDNCEIRELFANVVKHQHPLARFLLWSTTPWDRYPYVMGAVGVAPLAILAFGPKLDGWRGAMVAALAFFFTLGFGFYSVIGLMAAETVIAFSRRFSSLTPEVRAWRAEFAFAWCAALTVVVAGLSSALWLSPRPIFLAGNAIVGGIVVLIARRTPTRGVFWRSLSPVLLPLGMFVAALVAPIPRGPGAGSLLPVSIAAWALTILAAVVFRGPEAESER